MSKFSNSAKSVTTLSPLMNGRSKVDTKSLINKYPEGVTLIGFDLMHNGNDTYPLFIIKEEPAFFFGGSVLMNVVNEWLSMYDGDIDQCSHDLEMDGGVKVKLTEGRTKKGNNIINVEVVE